MTATPDRAMPAEATSKASEPTASESQRADSALRDWTAHLRLWLISGVCLWADLASKAWAFNRLSPEGKTLVPGFLAAQRSLNSGALYGSFSGWVPVFIVASLLALGFVLFIFAGSHRKQWFMHLGLAFILAGALGNLYDRAFVQADIVEFHADAEEGPSRQIGIIVAEDNDVITLGSYPDGSRARDFRKSDISDMTRHGVVRDFLKFVPIGGVDYWPWVFNIADALLVAGVIILVPVLWNEHRLATKPVDRQRTAS